MLFCVSNLQTPRQSSLCFAALYYLLSVYLFAFCCLRFAWRCPMSKSVRSFCATKNCCSCYKCYCYWYSIITINITIPILLLLCTRYTAGITRVWSHSIDRVHKQTFLFPFLLPLLKHFFFNLFLSLLLPLLSCLFLVCWQKLTYFYMTGPKYTQRYTMMIHDDCGFGASGEVSCLLAILPLPVLAALS